MPTNNPRVNVTLKPATAAVMRRLSELTGNSQSGMIAELLEANEATFARLITVLEAAQSARAALTEEMTEGLSQAQAKLEKQLSLVLETMEEGAAPILAAAEKVSRRTTRKGAEGAPRAGSGGALKGRGKGTSTPMSNRGVRYGPKTAKKPTRTRT